MRAVEFAPQARQDFEDVVIYYIDPGMPEIATRFRRAVESTATLAVQHPGIGQQLDLADPANTGIRFTLLNDFPKYLLFYRSSEETLLILRILHGARNVREILQS